MENKKMTAPNVSVGADTEQSPNVCTDSITDLEQDFKEIEGNAKRNVSSNATFVFANGFDG